MDMNKYTGFEKLLKDKLDNFEYPYNNKEWLDFEKKLPKSPKHFVSPKNIIRAFVIAAAVIVPVVAIVYLYNNSETQKSKSNVAITKNQNNQINNNSINDNNTNSNIQQNQNSDNFSNKNNSKTVNDINSNENISVNNGGNDHDKSSNTTNTTVKNSENNPVTNQNSIKNQMNSGYITANITEGCAPVNIQFKPIIISDTISYLWSFGDNSKGSVKKSPSHIYTNAGSFTVTLIVKFKKSGVTKKISYADFIKVKEAPEAKFSYSQDKETDVVTFNDNSINASGWYWSLGDKATSTEQNPQHEYFSDGSYNVRLIAINKEGCSDTNTTSIVIKNKPPFYISNAFTPNDSYNGYFGPTGVDMNPDGYKISIYSRAGKLVFETTDLNTKWDGKIKGSNVEATAGVYVCNVTMKNKHGILEDWPLYVTLIR